MEDLYYEIDCPTLYIGQRVGETKYIDFLKWNEVTHPVMKGIDIYKRRFIVIKVAVNQVRIMQTFFQRYTGGSGWMGCGHATTNLIDTTGNMKENQVSFLRNIINEENPIMKPELSPCLETFINHPVALYDEKKINAATIIQKAWRLCRYNPQYRMCYVVQNRNLDIILERNSNVLSGA